MYKRSGTPWISDDIQGPFLAGLESYSRHRAHFCAVSRGIWNGEKLGVGDVRWAQGQPLGTFPSFALLGLTHNAIGMKAARESGHAVPSDSFRVIGDDIIMDESIAKEYVKSITAIGGVINHDKSITSNRLCEFAGRLIRVDSTFRKNLKYLDPSDNSFMEYVAYLGPQGKSLLRPKQKKLFETFKYVPGVAVEGPWSRDSFGESFASRYLWYLTKSNMYSEEELVREDLLTNAPGLANRVWARVQEIGAFTDPSGRIITRDKAWKTLPFDNNPLWSDPHSMLIDPESVVPQSGDPRLINGKTLLQRMDTAVRKDSFQSYTDFQKDQVSLSSSEVGDSSPADAAPPVRKVSPESSDFEL
jgi:hypothetical protein